MKILLLAIVLACTTVVASAQTTPNLLQNNVNQFKAAPLKIDTTLRNFTFKRNNMGNNLLIFPLTGISHAVKMAFNGDKIVYSRMPVARLNSNDHMPVANITAGGDRTNVLRITVVDPLAGINAK